MVYTSIGKVSEIPKDGMKGFAVNGKKILVADVGGKLYAITSACTHNRGPLEKGTLDWNVVTCPWHASQFDVTTGRVVKGLPRRTRRRSK